jgi:tRNA 2-thiouridine synthesizing protein E
MKNTDYLVVRPGFIFNEDPDFPHAPQDWNREDGLKIATQMDIEMDSDRWDIVRALQEYYAYHEKIRVRELLDALDEKFHHQGGARFLLQKFPHGPVNQGCRIGGLTPPAGSIDSSFGTIY